MVNIGVTAPKGYKAAGVACGLKNNGVKDLALVVSDVEAKAAGIFTRNVIKGHSLQWSRKKIKNGLARAMVINSGCKCVSGPAGTKILLTYFICRRTDRCSPDELCLALQE